MKNESERVELARVIIALERALTQMADLSKRERITKALIFWHSIGCGVSLEERAEMLTEFGEHLKTAGDHPPDSGG